MSNDIKSGCSTQEAAFPDEITCPHCNADVEMWSDDAEVRCDSCGKTVKNTTAAA